jgi:dienelactone hydrolase
MANLSNMIPMIKISALFLFLLFSFRGLSQDCDSLPPIPGTPGPYEYATLLESDGIRNGPDYAGATMYYPIGVDAPLAGIAIVPGFFSPQSSIQAWGPFYASHGIVTLTIGTNSLLDLPQQRAIALIDAIETISQENEREASPLFGQIDTASFAVSGWSMGGGGAQLAASIDTTLKAVISLCPWLNPAEVDASDLDHSVPVLIFSGELDPTAPPSAHADLHYSLTPESTDKLIFEIENGNHAVANTPEGGNGEVGEKAISWLETFLLGKSCYCPHLTDIPASASLYETNVMCEEELAGCPEDINQDGLVNILDFLAFNSFFGQSCIDCQEDINGDGLVDVNDFLDLNGAMGSVCD